MRALRFKTILGVLLLSCIVAAAAGFAVFKLNGGTFFSVQTGSMSPSIQRGDLVAVTNVPDSQLAVGDVITYINPANADQTITHRLIEVPSETNQYRFITRGDANPAPDAPVAPSGVVGRSAFTVPYAGYAFDVVRRPLGLIALIYIPALVVIISEIRRLSEHYRKSQPYFASEVIRRRKLYALKRQSKIPGNATKLTLLVVVSFGVMSLPALAALSSSATLASNTITTKSLPPVPPTPPPNSSCSNNVNVSNTNNQTAQTGNASVTGDTTGGSAQSGNASNSSSTNINISASCRQNPR